MTDACLYAKLAGDTLALEFPLVKRKDSEHMNGTKQTRRGFLKTLGLGAAALAGDLTVAPTPVGAPAVGEGAVAGAGTAAGRTA